MPQHSTINSQKLNKGTSNQEQATMKTKTKLLKTLAGYNRGLIAQASDRQLVLDAIDRLEDENPTPRSTEASNLLAGDWRLIYTTSNSLLFIDLPPLVRLGQIYQSIRPETGKLYNIAEVSGIWPGLDSLICVSARRPVSLQHSRPPNRSVPIDVSIRL